MAPLGASDAAEVTYRNNVTSVALLGFSNLQNVAILLFLLLLVIYSLTISANICIIILFLMSKNLQTPMYFFITQLSIFDIIITTDILPNLLHIVLYDGCTMSLIECIIQYNFFGISECSECLLLSVMSYDRYLAICDPLHYHSIINHMFCVKSVIIVWIISVLIILLNSISIGSLHFCGPNVIDHFFCDFEPIVQLSCSDTSIIKIQTLVMSSFATFIPFIIIVMSYVYIAFTILKIPSFTGRQKAFSTCSSHLTVVTIFYGALIIVYVFPTRQLPTLSQSMSLCYTVIIPLLNPIIYTFRNKDFKEAFDKIKQMKTDMLWKFN